MTLALRPYQVKLYDEARARILAGVRALLIQSPTGSGKTVLVAQMLGTSARKGFRSWFVVHRRELVKQSVLTMTESAGIPLGIVAAGFPGNRHEPVQVCSVQTLAKRWHLLARPDLIVWDEAHHCAAASWDTLHRQFPAAVHIGLTATPERLDGTGLGRWFKEMLVGPSVADLIGDGWLSPYRLFAPAGPDLSGVHTVAGDYNKRELAAAMSSSAVVGDAIAHYRKYAMGKRAVVFMWSVESSRQMAANFNAAGIPAAHVDGGTDTVGRDAAIEGFRSGRILVLTNVDLFGEGFDVPAIEAAFLLRPTRSLALYLQQVGRALRPLPGKAEALIFDHAGNCRMHGLPDDVREWSLAGRVKKKREADQAPIKQCPMCYAVLSATAEACRHCGHVFVASPRQIEQLDGELAEVDVAEQRFRRLQEQSAAKSLDDLVRIGQLRGYKRPDRWAEHVWNARQAKQAVRDAERYARTGVL
jgi:DNA repair protein RadD